MDHWVHSFNRNFRTPVIHQTQPIGKSCSSLLTALDLDSPLLPPPLSLSCSSTVTSGLDDYSWAPCSVPGYLISFQPASRVVLLYQESYGACPLL